MAKPKNDKHKDYARYAAHCLDMVTTTKDQEARAINREMAAEWLKLADAIAHPPVGGLFVNQLETASQQIEPKLW
jgi:hypothetical protein